jgi:hypothetical protein
MRRRAAIDSATLSPYEPAASKRTLVAQARFRNFSFKVFRERVIICL